MTFQRLVKELVKQQFVTYPVTETSASPIEITVRSPDS